MMKTRIGDADTASVAAASLNWVPGLLDAVARKTLRRKERGRLPLHFRISAN